MKIRQLAPRIRERPELLVGRHPRNAGQLLHKVVREARAVVLRVQNPVDVVEEVVFGDRVIGIGLLEMRQCIFRKTALPVVFVSQIQAFLCGLIGLGEPPREALTITVEMQIDNSICHQNQMSFLINTVIPKSVKIK